LNLRDFTVVGSYFKLISGSYSFKLDYENYRFTVLQTGCV